MPQQFKPPLATVSRGMARSLRLRATDAERELWQRLRAGRLRGYKFRRQHPVPPYVVDFYCEAARLVIELDGSQHSDSADRVRTQALERSGCRVLHFWDNEVLRQLDGVLEAILEAAQARTLTPTPLPPGEGL